MPRLGIMTGPMYPQTCPVATPTPPHSWQWLAAGIAGIAGGFVVVSLVTGQVAYVLSGRSVLRLEQGVLIFAELCFGPAVVVAATYWRPVRCRCA
jgi:hypothetical protein